MVDIRRPVCGILVAGSPAPGINGVISAVVIQCVEWNLVPIGFMRGWKYLKQGLSDRCVELRLEDVTKMHNRGGSLLATSKEQLDTDEDVGNVIDVLRHLKVRYLITIGGTSSAFSSHKLATALRERSIGEQKMIVTSNIYNRNMQHLNYNNISHEFINDENMSQSPSVNLEMNGISPNNNNNNNNNNNINNNNEMNSIEMNGARINYSSNISSDVPDILITHVPKTIFNDLPLPENCYTFGFSTAIELGYKIVSNLSVDAKTMHRWYIVTCIGAKTGHLALNIGKAAASTITLIPEQFRHRNTKKHKPTQYKYESTFDISKKNNSNNQLNQLNNEMDKKESNSNSNSNSNSDDNNSDDKFNVPETPSPTLSIKNKNISNNIINNNNNNNNNENSKDSNRLKLTEIVDILDACIIKRLSHGKDYGVAVVSEGLVDMLDINDLNKYFDGNITTGHELLGPQLQRKLARRWSKRRHELYIRTKFIGFDLRSDDPNAHDILLSRNLGYAAVFSCKVKNINATIVAIKGGELVSIPLSEMMDPDTNSPTVKGVNTQSLTYTVAQSYMIKLTKSDLKDSHRLKKMADIARLNSDTFRQTYSYIAA